REVGTPPMTAHSALPIRPIRLPGRGREPRRHGPESALALGVQVDRAPRRELRELHHEFRQFAGGTAPRAGGMRPADRAPSHATAAAGGWEARGEAGVV